jgi:hypothetical protein
MNEFGQVAVDSSPGTLVFVCTVASVVVIWLLAIDSAEDLSNRARAASALVVLGGWLGLPAVLAITGRLDRYDPLPAPALLLVAALTAANIAGILSPIGRSLARHAKLPWLVGFQAFRIPVEWWLHHAYEFGFVPVQMTYAGRNFDVITGITALALGIWLAVGRVPRGVVLAWNLLGLALLINIVVVAILATPVPFRVFADGPPNLLPSTFPFVWLPTFLVQAALAGHLLVFRALKRIQ